MPPKFRIEPGSIFHREAQFKAASIDEDKRTVELAFSSEQPVLRYFGWEILDHSGPDSADLSRLNNKAALLFNHWRDLHLGIVEKAWIDPGDKMGRAVVRFGKNPLASEKFEDVRDGILTKISFAYELVNASSEVTSQEGEIDTRRFTNWHPLEISFVTIPADDSVGVGRDLQTQPPKRMPQENASTAATPPPAPEVRPAITITKEDMARAVKDALESEQERVLEITTLGRDHNVPAQEIDRFIREKTPADQFVRHILKNNYGAQPIDLARDSGTIGMNEKEIRSYSLVRALRSAANGRPIDGLEAEASAAVAKRIKRDPEGFFVPSDITTRSIIPNWQAMNAEARSGLAAGLTALRDLHGRRREQQFRALSAGTDAAGGYTVATEVLGSSLIELLRNAMLMMDLGAINLTGLVGDIAIPSHTGAVTAAWLTEGSAITPSDQTFGQLALTPKRLGGATAYSKQLLAQASIDIESFVRMDIAETLAVAKDLGALNGSGSSGQPRGILNTSGIGTVTISTPGQPTWANIVEFETDVATSNALRGAPAYVTTPAVRGYMKVTLKTSAVSGYLWTDDAATPVNGYPGLVTNQMPTNGILFGNFRELVIADWDGIDIVVDPYSLSLNNQVRIVINMLTDVGVRHAGGFSKNA